MDNENSESDNVVPDELIVRARWKTVFTYHDENDSDENNDFSISLAEEWIQTGDGPLPNCLALHFGTVLNMIIASDHLIMSGSDISSITDSFADVISDQQHVLQEADE